MLPLKVVKLSEIRMFRSSPPELFCRKDIFKGTLVQISKSPYMFVFM